MAMTSDGSHLTWRKSSHSTQQGECVELARASAAVCVRDSKDTSGPLLALTPGHARTLTARIKDGELDL